MMYICSRKTSMRTAKAAEMPATGIRKRLHCSSSALAKDRRANMQIKYSKKDPVRKAVLGRIDMSGFRMNSSEVVMLFMLKMRKMWIIM